MEHTEAKQAMKELTMMLIYLSRYCEQEEFAESEFEKYRVIQDSLYQSDFDCLLNSVDDEI